MEHGSISLSDLSVGSPGVGVEHSNIPAYFSLLIPYRSGARAWGGVEHGSTPNLVPYTLAYRRASGGVTEGVG